MPKINSWPAWLKKSDGIQCKWALKYLSQKGIRIQEGVYTSPYNQVMATVNNLPPHYDSQKLFRLIRGAWSQKQQRNKKNGKKSFNFIMATAAQSRLEELAKHSKKPINKTLEDIIMGGGNEAEKMGRDKILLAKFPPQNRELGSENLTNIMLVKFAEKQIEEASLYQAKTEFLNSSEELAAIEKRRQEIFAKKYKELHKILRQFSFFKSTNLDM